VEFCYKRGVKTSSKMLFALIAAAALSLALPASANLVTNPGFETGDFTGWNRLGDTSFTGVDSSNPHSGHFAAFFGSEQTFLEPTLNTVPGSTYSLSFWLANTFETPGHGFAVFWNGMKMLALFDEPVFGYTHFSFSVFAPGSQTELRFVFLGSQPGLWYLDDVSVAGPSHGVPEPFSTLWLALPFAGMVAYRRFRAKSV
jgi:hypothetical protein